MRYPFPIIIPVAILKVVRWVTLRYYKMRTPLLAWVWGIKHGRHLLFQGKTIIRTRRHGDIVLGDNVIFNSEQGANLVGLMNPTILDTRFGGRIVVSDRSGASSVVISSMSSVKIGSRCKIGGNVRIFDHDFHSIEWTDRRPPEKASSNTRPVIIGNDVFIGTNAIILKGTHIGDRSVVAAGSVVFGLEVPPDSIVKGNPAKVLSRRLANSKSNG